MASLFKLNILRISAKTLNTVEVLHSKMWVPTYPTAHECLNLCDEQVPELGINLDLFVLFLGGEEIAKFFLPICLKSPTEFILLQMFFLRQFPHKPVTGSRAFFHKDYPGSWKQLENSIQTGELYLIVVLNAVNIWKVSLYTGNKKQWRLKETL